MFRYLRLFLYFVRFSISKATEFRVDFTFRIFMDCLYYAVNIAFYKILLLHFPQIAGWKEPQVMIFVAGYLFVDALHMTLFSNNTWWLPVFVNRGDLDYYLVRPVSSLFFLSFRDFAANSFMNLIVSIGILLWAFLHYPETLSFTKSFIYFILLLNGTFLYYSVSLIFILSVFWTHSTTGLKNIFHSFTRIAERPDPIFRGWVRRVFTLVLPFCLMSSFPARFLFETLDWKILVHIVGVSLFFGGLVLFIWRLGLRSYSSASS